MGGTAEECGVVTGRHGRRINTSGGGGDERIAARSEVTLYDDAASCC